MREEEISIDAADKGDYKCILARHYRWWCEFNRHKWLDTSGESSIDRKVARF